MDDKIFKIVGDLLGLLEQLVEERGVPKDKSLADKNIINPSIGSKGTVPTGLTPANKRILTETFTLFNKMFFDYQKKAIPDKAEKTLVTRIAKTQTPRPPSKPTEVKKPMGLMGMIMAGLGLLAASVGGLVMALTGAFGDFSGVAEVIGKVGFVGALKILSKTIMKRFAISALKRLPFIGGIISFAFAVKAFKEGEIFKGVGHIISGLLNFIPGVGPFLSLGADILIAWAEGKGMFKEGGALSNENGLKTIKGWVGDLGKFIWKNALYTPILATFKRFGMASDSFKDGKYTEGLRQIGFGMISLGMPWVVNGIETLMGFLDGEKAQTGEITPDKSWDSKLWGWIQSKFKYLPWPIKQALAWFGLVPDDQVGAPAGMLNTLTGGALASAKESISKLGKEWMEQGKEFGGNMVSSAKEYTKLVKDSSKEAWAKTKTWWGDMWKDSPTKMVDNIDSFNGDMVSSAKEYGSWLKNASGKAWEKSKTAFSSLFASASVGADNITTSTKGVVKEAKDAIAQIKVKTDNAGEVIYKEVSDLQDILVSYSATQNVWLSNLYNAALKQVEMLGLLVNVGNSSLHELKKMSGNNSGGGNTVSAPPYNPLIKTVMVPVVDNRLGYSSSTYAIN